MTTVALLEDTKQESVADLVRSAQLGDHSAMEALYTGSKTTSSRSLTSEPEIGMKRKS